MELQSLYSLFSNVICISIFLLSNPCEIVPTNKWWIMQILIEFVIITIVCDWLHEPDRIKCLFTLRNLNDLDHWMHS